MQFLLVLLTQVFAVTCILVAYGVSQNLFQEEKKEIEYMNKFFGISLTSYEEQPDGSYKPLSPKSVAEIKAKLDELLPLLGDKVDDYYLCGFVTLNGKSYSIYGDTKSDPDSPSNLTAADRMSESKVISVCRHEYPCEIGDTIQLGNASYTVAAADVPGVMCPRAFVFGTTYANLPEDTAITGGGITLADAPTEEEAEEIAALIYSYFGGETRVHLPVIPDLVTIQFNRLALAICTVIAVLVLLNVSLVYFYLLSQRTRMLGIYHLCGCTEEQIQQMLSLEWFVILNICFAGAFLLFRSQIMERLSVFMETPELFYTSRVYLGVYIGYILFSVGLLLMSSISRQGKTTAEQLREV